MTEDTKKFINDCISHRKKIIKAAERDGIKLNLEPINHGIDICEFILKCLDCEAQQRKDGLTIEEGQVMDALITAWNKFVELEQQHPDEQRDFADGIHKCQDLLAVRIARREYPDGWPIKK